MIAKATFLTLSKRSCLPPFPPSLPPSLHLSLHPPLFFFSPYHEEWDVHAGQACLHKLMPGFEVGDAGPAEGEALREGGREGGGEGDRKGRGR